jgi:hypothetical protein
MLGFGLNGLLAVTHGAFEPRREAIRPASQDTAPDEQIGQNADHG